MARFLRHAPYPQRPVCGSSVLLGCCSPAPQKAFPGFALLCCLGLMSPSLFGPRVSSHPTSSNRLSFLFLLCVTCNLFHVVWFLNCVWFFEDSLFLTSRLFPTSPATSKPPAWSDSAVTLTRLSLSLGRVPFGVDHAPVYNCPSISVVVLYSPH